MNIDRFGKKAYVLLLVVLLAICVAGLEMGVRYELETSGKTVPVIVIDPGHGGIDPGKVGINNSYEKDINLLIASYLKQALEKKKYKVIMTREADRGLYSDTDGNKKMSDMNKRVDIMNQTDVDLVVSIHQNSFPQESSKGAQVFYHTGSATGENIAKLLQAQLAAELDEGNHRQAKGNTDYFILRKTQKPAVIVECGFLSNSEEAAKLCEKSYQRQVAWAIAGGVEKAWKQYLKK